MYKRHILGIEGENIACKFLKSKGYKILLKNFRCRQGEIDIIAKDRNEIVFVEVKTRVNFNYGFPSEAVDRNKRNRIIKASKYFLYVKKLENRNIRFDVIEIIKKDKFYVRHIKNVELIWRKTSIV